jgi:hypothetical protein
LRARETEVLYPILLTTYQFVDAKLLRGVVKRLTPDVDMRQTFSCSSCGHEGDMEVPFTVEFFGLSDEYIQNVYEQFFILQYHGGWSFIEAYNLPIK